MINLKDHIIDVEGAKWVPLEIAEKAIKEATEKAGYINSIKAIDDAIGEIKTSMKEFNTSLNNLDKDD